MRTRRAFHYNIRRRNRRRNHFIPYAVAFLVLVLAGFTLLPLLGHRGTNLTKANGLAFESWHPPQGRTRPPNDEDLAQLQTWLDETNNSLYAGTFPSVRIEWAEKRDDAYAFAENGQIRFVRSEFFPGWSGNREVVLHEMAHVATGHDHDILWDQERARLAEGKRVMTFEQVRAASR
jgi:hypothetical protein